MVSRLRSLAPGAVAVAVLAGCGGGTEEPLTFAAPVQRAAALTALADGGLRYGELDSGVIRDVRRDGRIRPGVVARISVGRGGQRGLLGLAVDRRGRTFAAWTRPDRRLVVGRVAPGPERLVWRGPRSADLANGGHLAFAPDGRLVIGVGDLQAPERIADPRAPNGKLLALDPGGRPDQRPAVLSAGWNNPYAFAYTPSGELWVADNAPGRRPERLARGDLGPGPRRVTVIEPKVAASGLAALADGRLALCGVVSRHLDLYEIEDGRARALRDDTPAECLLGVARLRDGRLVLAREDDLRVLRP